MPGVFILSLDTEIAWGSYTRAEMRSRAPIFDEYRTLLPCLVALLDQYQIPATWAVVGHLFLRPQDEPPPVLQPHYSWAARPDWERAPDPAHPAWYYGPDVIDAICEAQVAHEVGTHTFTHVIADDSSVTAEVWDSQLAACARVHRARGLPLHSLVYPIDRVAHTDRLARHGLVAYRGVERTWYAGLDGPLARLCHLVDRALAIAPATYSLAELRPANGVVELPASQFLMAYDGVRRLIPTASRVRQARRGLAKALAHDEIFHLWFHPFNLGTHDAMFAALERILQQVARHREEDGLRVMTMAEAANLVLDASK